MELTLTELGIIIAAIVGIVGVYYKLTPTVRWRATVDAKIERLEDGKDKLFDKLEQLERKLDTKLEGIERKLDALDDRADAHEQGCAEWRGRMDERMKQLGERRG